MQISLISRVFANDLGDLGSIPSLSHSKNDAFFLITQNYKVWINGKVEESREWSCSLLYTSVL